MPNHEGRLRVYWLTEAFYPPIVGGQELFVARIVQALSARGVAVSVITRQSEAPAPARETIGSVDVRRIPPAGILKGKGWSALFPLLGYLGRLLFILVTELARYDVVIVSGVKLMPLVIVPVCLLTGKKCILRAESFFELKEAVSAESLRDMGAASGRTVVGALDRLRMAMLRRAGSVIAISNEIREVLLSRGINEERIRQIPNAADLSKFKPVSAAQQRRLREKLSLPVDRTLFVYAGRFSRAKGLPMLIEAWPALLERHPQLCLVMVGSGKLSFDNCEDELLEFARTRHLENDVIFAAENDHVYEYLQAADLFIFPTDYEGFSLALVEALGCGMPVVVTAVGAAPDLIQDERNGFLFPPKQPAAMVAAIESALGQRDRWPEIGAAARESVGRFDLAAVADQYLGLCHELMRGRQSTSPPDSQ